MEVKILPAALSWLFTVFSLYFFIIRENKNEFEAAILGFLIYGIYETTNLALFKKWTLLTVLIDSVWGGILFFITTFIFYNYKKLTSS